MGNEINTDVKCNTNQSFNSCRPYISTYAPSPLVTKIKATSHPPALPAAPVPTTSIVNVAAPIPPPLPAPAPIPPPLVPNSHTVVPGVSIAPPLPPMPPMPLPAPPPLPGAPPLPPVGSMPRGPPCHPMLRIPKTIILCAQSTDTILDIKRKVEDYEGIPPERQRVFLCRNQLDDAKTLSYYGIEIQSKLHLIIKYSAHHSYKQKIAVYVMYFL